VTVVKIVRRHLEITCKQVYLVTERRKRLLHSKRQRYIDHRIPRAFEPSAACDKKGDAGTLNRNARGGDVKASTEIRELDGAACLESRAGKPFGDTEDLPG
jgi:hypothetical protein